MSAAPHPRHFEVAPGLRLRADAWGEPSAPPVLFWHGGGQTRHAWHGTARRLAGAGWYALCLDMRGHGESDWSTDADYHHDDFARDVAAVSRQFETPPVCVGASLGGIASLIAIAEASGPLASALVLVDIATRMEMAGAERIVDFMKQKPEGFESLEEVADAVARYNPHRPRPADLSGLRKNLREGENGRLHWHWDPAFLAGAPRVLTEDSQGVPDRDLLDECARALEIPTLLVRGRMSDLLSEEGARDFLKLVPHARFADVSGAGHMVAGDRNDAFTAAVETFLASEVAVSPGP